MRKPGCQGPPWAWRTDNQIPSAGCSAPGKGYSHPGTATTWEWPGARKAREGDERLLHVLLVSWPRLREGLSWVVLRPHDPLRLPSTTPITCSVQGAKYCSIPSNFTRSWAASCCPTPCPSSLSPLDTEPTQAFLPGFIVSPGAATQPNNSPGPGGYHEPLIPRSA